MVCGLDVKASQDAIVISLARCFRNAPMNLCVWFAKQNCPHCKHMRSVMAFSQPWLIRAMTVIKLNNLTYIYCIVYVMKM